MNSPKESANCPTCGSFDPTLQVRTPTGDIYRHGHGPYEVCPDAFHHPPNQEATE